jgi:2-polyprenyl-3-methyl-5-hydroxy-6-metoxy-1,4-benzoquinol methylase
MESFAKFEHDGWQRVAGKYDSVWSSSTRQFISLLLDAAEVSRGMSVLDVGCGPGYVSAAAAARGATPHGLDFSKEMIGIAQKMFPKIKFQEVTHRIYRLLTQLSTVFWLILRCSMFLIPSAPALRHVAS